MGSPHCAAFRKAHQSTQYMAYGKLKRQFSNECPYDYKRCSGQSSVPLLPTSENAEPCCFNVLRTFLLILASALLIFVMFVFIHIILDIYNLSSRYQVQTNTTIKESM